MMSLLTLFLYPFLSTLAVIFLYVIALNLENLNKKQK